MIGYNDDIVFFSIIQRIRIKDQPSLPMNWSQIQQPMKTQVAVHLVNPSLPTFSALRVVRQFQRNLVWSGHLQQQNYPYPQSLLSVSPGKSQTEWPWHLSRTGMSYIISDKMVEIMHQKGYICECVNNLKIRCHAFMFD